MRDFGSGGGVSMDLSSTNRHVTTGFGTDHHPARGSDPARRKDHAY